MRDPVETSFSISRDFPSERRVAFVLERKVDVLSCIVWRARRTAFHGNENICRSAGRLRRARSHKRRRTDEVMVAAAVEDKLRT